VGKHHYRRNLHSCCVGPALDSSTLCRATETRASLSKCNSLHSNGISVVAHSAWTGARPAVDNNQGLEIRLQAGSTGIVFLVSFVSLQWPFANFLMSPLSRNRIFGTNYFAYDDTAGFMYDPFKFQASEKTRIQFWFVMSVALIAAILTTRLGFIWANWIKRVQR